MSGRINHDPDLQEWAKGLQDQIDELNRKRFQPPKVATDPVNHQNGDMWLNTTSNQLKIVDSAGTVRVITWT